MHVILIMVGAIGMMIGSMIAGVLACWLLWSAFKLFGRPEWGPPFVLVPAAMAIAGQLPTSPFLVMFLIFAGLAVAPFCFEGVAWRKRQNQHDNAPTSGEFGAPFVHPSNDIAVAGLRYPAITGCIGDGRDAEPDELKKVAARMMKEAHPSGSTMAGKRAALRAAKLALNGNRSSVPRP